MSRKRSSLLIIAITVVIPLITAAAYFMLANPSDTPLLQEDGGTPDTLTESQAEAKKNLQETLPTKTGESSSSTENTNSDSTVSLALKQQNENVIITTSLLRIGDGSCELTVTNGNTSKSYTAAVIYQRTESTCAGFSIPKSDFGAGGWTVNLAVADLAGNKYSTNGEIIVE